MNLHELQQENQALKYRNDKLKADRRKLQIALASRDKRIEAMYRVLEKNGIPVPAVEESRNVKQLLKRGYDLEDTLEALADEEFSGPPNKGTPNFGYERGRHDGFKQAIRQFCD